MDHEINLLLDNKPICQTNSVKYLGVLIDSNPCRKLHIHVGILSKLRHYASTDILISVFYAFIHSFVIYGIEVWSQTYPSHFKAICTLQKKAVRIITFSDPHSHSEVIFKSLRIVKFTDLIELLIPKFVYLWHSKQLPPCFCNFYNSLDEIHSIQTRQAQNKNIHIKSFNTDQFGKISLRYFGATLWNKIPVEIKESLSLTTFMKKLKNYQN